MTEAQKRVRKGLWVTIEFHFMRNGHGHETSMKILRVLIFADFADWPRSAKISYRRIKKPEKENAAKN